MTPTAPAGAPSAWTGSNARCRAAAASPPRDLPAPDPATFLRRSFAEASYRYTARMTVGLAADDLRGRLFAHLPGDVQDLGPDACAVRISADSAELVTQYIAAIAALDVPCALDAPAEITERLRGLARRLAR